MKHWYKKQMKHRCSIPGCHNVRTTLYSGSRAWGAAVYLCDEHIQQIIDDYNARHKPEQKPDDIPVSKKPDAEQKPEAEKPQKKNQDTK